MGFEQLIKNTTRPAGGKGTCIDWVLNNSEYVAMSFVSNDLSTDHYPIITVRKKSREAKGKVTKLTRLYNKLDLRILGNLVNNFYWKYFNDNDDPNFKWSFIRDGVSKIIEVMCPLKKIYVRKSQPPWFNNNISKLIRDREVLSRLFRNTGDSDVLRELKIVRNRVTEAVREARGSYITLSLSHNKKNPRIFWRIINSFYVNKESSEYDGHFVNPETGIDVPTENVFLAKEIDGIYPKDWSFGYVNLIPKQGLLSSPTNWRPITQTHIFGKNLVHRSLLRYFLESGVLSDKQYGFLPGRSTHDAIFDLVRHIHSSINNKKLMGLLFLSMFQRHLIAFYINAF